MRALVLVASKHGSTKEIGAEITRSLNAAGIATDLRRMTEPFILHDYDAVILGSGVYMGKWLPEAIRFIEEHEHHLMQRPVWLFSSGPIGEPPKGSVGSGVVQELMERTGARDHRVFPGRLDAGELGVKERIVTTLIHAPAGDYREWPAIRAWAEQIAAELKSTPVPVTASPA